MLITKEASLDGSVMVAHSDDSELFDQRLVRVPAADHKPGELRPVYYDASSLGDKPEYHTYALRRYVGTDRGPVYNEPNRPKSMAGGNLKTENWTGSGRSASGNTVIPIILCAGYGGFNQRLPPLKTCLPGSKTDLPGTTL